MGKLSRMQVYLEKWQMERLKQIAKKKNASVAALIRSAIDLFLEKDQKEVDWENDPLTKAIGAIKPDPSDTSDITDLSVNHDYYLYGGKKKKP